MDIARRPVTRALVVDDSRLARTFLRTILEKHRPDWNVREATNGDEALAAASTEPADVFIIDYHMPGMDGLALGRALRERYPGAYIAMLTANVQDALRARARAIGIDFFGKPITEARIVGIVDACSGAPESGQAHG